MDLSTEGYFFKPLMTSPELIKAFGAGKFRVEKPKLHGFRRVLTKADDDNASKAYKISRIPRLATFFVALLKPMVSRTIIHL